MRGVFKMEKNEIVKSEIGSEAAWRGFSTQTLYIAKRLLTAENDDQLYPEQVEDLMITRKERIIELVQVKNLSDDLSLSDLSPKKNDSFFRRCLKFKKSEEICLKIVSFGNIGSELQNMLKEKEKEKSSIYNKLLSYGYSENDTLWLLNHLEIEEIRESEIENTIKETMKKYVEIVAYNLVKDNLIYYIYKLSREKGYTSKKCWEEKVNNIVKDLMAIDSMQRQYQRTIIPLYDYKSNKTGEELLNDYRMGINASPDHIRSGCDLRRGRWLDEIKGRFLKNNIVLIKGASGQGKTTLAYRYLIDNYPELNIMCIQRVTSENQAIDILSVLRGLNARKDIVVYIDVEPYDIQWLWICEKALELAKDIKILISIREEDFQRSPIDYSKHNFEEISIEFSKDEAIELYEIYPNTTYLSFENAWKSFGENGPLMEYIFMLNESRTLADRIKAQIENIVNHEEEADSWLESLVIISLAGIHDNSVSVSGLFQKVQCKRKFKMIKHFEKEYFVKVTQNSSYVESLHVLRARIIYNILMEMGIFNKEDILINTLEIIEHNATQMLIEYVYEAGITQELVNRVAKIRCLSVEIYADILKALLWCEIYYYFEINRKVIEEGDVLFNNQFMFLGNTDITGLLQMDLLHDISKVFNEVNPYFEEQMIDQLNKLPLLKLEYKFLDAYLINTCKNLRTWFQIREDDLTAWGYVLFWVSYRNIYLNEFSANDLDWNSNIEGTMNYVLGISKQGWFETRNKIVESILPAVLQENGVIYFEVTDDEVFALINVLLGNEQGEPHSRVMKMVSICQRLFPEKKKYHVKISGYQLLEGLEVPDTQKNISQEHLPYVWITQLNGCFGNMHKYNTLPENWSDVYKNIANARNAVLKYFEILLKGIEKFYRNENADVFKMDTYKEKKSHVLKLTALTPYIEPKCAVDKYGIRDNNYVVEEYDEKYSNRNRIESDKEHISCLCREYFSRIHVFCENAENILIDAKLKKQPGQQSRIAYYSLVQALMKLEVFQKRFDDYFKEFGNYQKKDLETELLEKVVATFTIVFYNHFLREKSISYKAKESMRVTERKIEQFMEYGIKTLPGVKNVISKEKMIEIDVDIFEYEAFLAKFYHSIKRLAKNMDNVSFPGYLLQKNFSNLNVNIICDEKSVFRRISIPVKNILIYQEYEKFCSTLLPNEEGMEIEIINPFQAAVQGIALLTSLKKMFMYTTEIEQELFGKSGKFIVKQVYCQYQNKVINIVHETINSLNNIIECIYLNKVIDISEITDIKRILEETGEQMRDVIFDVAKEASYEQIEDLFNQFIDVFGQYVDASGIMAVS